MKRPSFFWTHAVLKKYAHIHVTPPYLKTVTDEALDRVQGYPFKYYCLSHLTFFLFEFILPLFFGYVSRFSRLSDPQALHIILTFQNTACLPLRILVSLVKIPVLLSLRPDVLKEASYEA